MCKKFAVTILVFALCLLNVSVLAKTDSTQAPKDKTTQEVVLGDEASESTITEEVDENSDAEEEVPEEAVTEETDETSDTEEEVPEEVGDDTEDTTTDEEAVEPTEDTDTEESDETTVDQPKGNKGNKANNGKSKVIKEELAAQKQLRAEKRTEAKAYIRGLHTLFKGADPETKKEILAEIAKTKKELKDYSIGVFVRGMVVDFEKYDNVKPCIKDNRTLVPIRAIAEAFGAVVDWNEETSTVTITKDSTIIVMQLGSNIATVNGAEVTLEVAPATENGRTLIPVRFVSESLKLGVEWDENSQSVIIE